MNDNNSSYTTDEDDFWNYNHPYDIMTGERLSSRYEKLEPNSAMWFYYDQFKYRRLVGAYQIRQEFFSIGEQQQEEATQEMLNTMDEKCIDNPDFVYCNNN